MFWIIRSAGPRIHTRYTGYRIQRVERKGQDLNLRVLADSLFSKEERLPDSVTFP